MEVKYIFQRSSILSELLCVCFPVKRRNCSTRRIPLIGLSSNNTSISCSVSLLYYSLHGVILILFLKVPSLNTLNCFVAENFVCDLFVNMDQGDDRLQFVLYV